MQNGKIRISTIQYKRQAVQSAKWAFLSNLVPQIVPSFLALSLARLLSPEDYGIVGIGSLILALLGTIQHAGLRPIVIQREDSEDEAASMVFWLGLGLSLVLYICLWIMAPQIADFYEEPRASSVLRVLGVQLVISAMSTPQAALLERFFKFKRFFIIQVSVALLPFVVSVPLALKGSGYWALVYGTLASSSLSAILLWWKSAWRPIFVFDFQLARGLLGFGGFVLLESLLGWLLVYFDNAVIGKVLGSEALGVYVLAFNLAILVVGIPLSAITGIALPLFSRLQNDPSSLKRAYLEGTRIVAFYAIPAGIGLSIVAEPAVALICGEKWEYLGRILSILALYSGFGHLWVLNSDAFKAIGRPGIMTRIYIPVLVIMIPLYLVGAQYGLFTFTILRSMVVLVGAVPHTWYAVRTLSLPSNYLWNCCRVQLIACVPMAMIVFSLSKVACQAEGYAQWVLLISCILFGAAVYLGTIFYLDRNLILTVRSFAQRSFKAD